MLAAVPGLIYGFAGHDSFIHALWAKRFSALLAGGEIYPRFDPEVFLGNGSYAFFFYPPLTIYINSAFSFLGSESNYFMPVINTSMILAILTAIATSYFWLRNYEMKVRLLGVALYIFFPPFLAFYAYISTGVGMVWAYAFAPLLLMGIVRIIENRRYGFALYTFAQTLIILTNIPATIIYLPIATIYGFYCANKKSHYAKLIFSSLLSLIICAVYILPMIFLKDLMNLHSHWDTVIGFKYQEHFVNFSSFIDSKAPYFLIIVLTYVLTVGLVLFLLKKLGAGLGKKSIFSIVIIISILFLSCSLSSFLWEQISILQIIQFPFRFMLATPLFLVPIIAKYVEQDVKERIMQVSAIIIIPAIILAIFVAYISSNKIQHIPSGIKAYFTNNIEYYPHYTPKKDDLYKYFFITPLDELKKNRKVEIMDGAMAGIKNLTWQPREITAEISAESGAKIWFRRFYIDGWQAEIDGERVLLEKDDFNNMIVSTEKDYKNSILKISLPPYWHERLGAWLSAFGMLILIASLICSKFRRNN